MRGGLQTIVPGDVLEALGNALDAQIAYVGSDLRYRYANTAYLSRLARPSLNILGKTMAEVLGQETYALFREHAEAAVAGEPSEFEAFLKHPTAGVRTVVARYVPDTQPDGTVNGFIEMVRDVTEGRKRKEREEIVAAEKSKHERALATSERRFRTLVDESPLSIQMFEPSGRCIHANNAWERLFSTKLGANEDYNVLQDPQLQEAGVAPLIGSVLSGGAVQIPPFHYDPTKSGRNGRARWVSGVAYPVKGDDEKVQEVVVVLQDVTAEREAQEQLQAARERFQMIVDSALDAVIMIDANHEVITWDAQAEGIFGYSRKEALGAKIYELIIPEEFEGAHIKGVERYLKSGKHRILNQRVELIARHKSGRVFPVEGSIAPIQQNGQTVFSAFLSDISDRKEAEAALQRLNSELEARVSQRTEELQNVNRELESFAYSVAHELRSPLRRMTAVAHLLQEEYDDKLDKQGQTYLYEIREFCKHMSDLVADHLEYARLSRSEVHISSVDVSRLVWQVIREVQERYPNAEFHVRVLPTLQVDADESQLRVVLEALLDNAAKFSSAKAKPQIEFGASSPKGERVFYVRDNGIGFDSAFEHKLFMPFERLHGDPQYAGTGVGLANSKRILDRHGGRIWAKSEVGKGTTFFFTLGTG